MGALLTSLTGAGLMASSKGSTSNTGSHIVLAGLLMQIVIFGFFVVVVLVFHRRLTASPTPESHDAGLPWKRFMYVLYVTSSFILVRNIVRVAEFVEGFDGYIILHEVFLYIFDALPMMAVIVIFGIWNPSNFRISRGVIDGSKTTKGSDVVAL
jgi:high-affinity Fe2+/Pb2+ permease